MRDLTNTPFRMVPDAKIIHDKQVVHHGNLGGACHVYLRNFANLSTVRELLTAEPDVEEIYDRVEAAATSPACEAHRRSLPACCTRYRVRLTDRSPSGR